MPVTPVDATPPPAAVQTVIVTAARLPPAPGDAAFSIIRLTPQQLQAEPRLDLALQQIPGISLFRRTSSAAENPTTQGVTPCVPSPRPARAVRWSPSMGCPRTIPSAAG